MLVFRRSYKNQKTPKKCIYDICLCYPCMFRCSYKNQKTPKKCIYDIRLCYPCMFRCCTKGRGSAPLCDSQRTSTNQCSLQLAPCRGQYPHMCKNTPHIIESKNAKTSLLVYWMRLRQQYEQGPWLWRPLPLVAPVLVCSDSPRMEAGRADS